MVAGGAIGRAVLEAYKEAAAGRGAAAAAAQKVARRRMSLDEAVKAGPMVQSSFEMVFGLRFGLLLEP